MTKLLRTICVVHIVVLLFLFSSTLTMAATLQNGQLTLELKEVTVKELVKAIRQQSQYGFIYDNKKVGDITGISVHLTDATVEEVLKEALKDTNLTYEIKENTIIIKSNPPKALLERRVIMPVSGKVTSYEGESLPGVNVLEKGTGNGTVTDIDGNYKLEVAEEATLVFSFIGYKTQEVAVNGRSLVDISIEEDIKALGEIVVVSTGYQTISKERVTGAYDAVQRRQLEKPTTNIGTRIIGTTAGVQSSFDEDGNPSFEIRGQTSLNANKQPLVVVDGFAIQGGLNSVNPNDVESITILKDAAAASIWGARSSNGVIVITTKKANDEDNLKIDFSTFTKVGKKLNLDYVNPTASSSETVDYEIEAYNKWRAPIPNPTVLPYYFFNWSQVATTFNEFDQGFLIEEEKDATITRLRNQSNRDEIRDELLAVPLSQQYNLSLRSSSGRVKNTLSLLYEANQTNFQGTENKEYMANYRTSAEIFPWLSVNVSALLQRVEATANGVNLSEIKALSPYDMLRDENGDLTNISKYYAPIIERFVPTELFPYPDWGYNPIQEVDNRDITSRVNNMRLQGGLNFKILPGLTVDTKLQYESSTSQVRQLYKENSFYVRSLVNEAASWNMGTNQITLNLPKGGILNQSRNESKIYNYRIQVNFNKEIMPKHYISFAGGSEVTDGETYSMNNPITYGFDDRALTSGIFPNGATGTRNFLGRTQNFSYSPSFQENTDRFFSIYGNLAYTYDSKYTLSGSYRTDASNLITDDPKLRYDPFWSIGLAWQIEKEGFLKEVSWVESLTLRSTYGLNGNIDKSTSFKPLIFVSSSPNVATGYLTGSITSFGNPSLRWEKTATWNVGIDYSLFGGAVFGKFDIYQKNGKDIIASLSIPAVNGTTSQKFNNAAMTNKGLELTLGTVAKIKANDITWRGSLNFSYNQNEITDLYVANYNAYSMVFGGSSAYVEGENTQSLWTFMYGGLDENSKPTHLDSNGNMYNFTVSALPGNGLDYVTNKGTKVAPYTLGFSSVFDIYDFELSFIMTGKFGHVFKRQAFNYPALFTGKLRPNSSLSEVRGAESSQIIPLPTTDEEPNYFLWDRYYPFMDYLAENASHLRMQEINLTYNIPFSKFSKSNAQAQVYVQANNVFTLKANDYGEDPEFTLGSVKPEPTVIFGAKITF